MSFKGLGRWCHRGGPGKVIAAVLVMAAVAACSAELPGERSEAPTDDAAPTAANGGSAPANTAERGRPSAHTAARKDEEAVAGGSRSIGSGSGEAKSKPSPATSAPATPAPKSRGIDFGASDPASGSEDGAAVDEGEPTSLRRDAKAGGSTSTGSDAPGGLGRRTRGFAPTASSAPPPDEDWTLVPVYYGTDRERQDAEDRIGYSWKRGRRLELGQVMISVPKNHVEPRIERPFSISIPFTNIKIYEASEDPAEHFTVQEIAALSEQEFLSLIKARLQKSAQFKDHALVFVHGYQTTFDNAAFRTAQIAFDLKFDGAPFLYSWPSGGTLQGYTYDRESAAQAERYLREFLDLVTRKSGAKKVSIIAHSMGNQLLLRVLQDMKRSLPEGLILSQLILAAPDVDRDSFENIVSSITGIAEGITLYAAANDQALMFSMRLNGGVPRAGDVPSGVPIIISGVDSIDATATSMDSLGINHAGYAENKKLLGDIRALIETGVRPPKARVPDLEVIEVETGQFWRYPSPN